MPVLQVFEPVQGSQFDGKYFVDVIGQGGPKLSSNSAEAKIMSNEECRAVAETWAAWHTFKVIEIEPQNIEQRIYKHGVGFMATCPKCGRRKRMIDIRGKWWFICPCSYQIELGNTQAVKRRPTSASS